MEIRTQTRGAVVVVHVRGDIDGQSAAEFQRAVTPQVVDGSAILLDLGEVEYLSSAGLRVLLLLQRQTQAQRARLVLAGLSEELRETMFVTGFDRHLTICDTLEAGLAALA